MDRSPLALVVDSDPAVRTSARDELAAHEIHAMDAASGFEVEQGLAGQPIDIVLLDVQTPGLDPLEVLRQSLQREPPPIVACWSATVDEAERLIDGGAFDVLVEGIDAGRLRLLIDRVVREHRLQQELRGLRLERAETLRSNGPSRPIADMPRVARRILAEICTINGLPAIDLAPDALEQLARHDWHQNVAELRDVIEQAALLAEQGRIHARHLPERLREGRSAESAPAPQAQAAHGRRFRDAKREVVQAFEREYLRDLMERHGGNVTAASHQAGMLRSALQRLLRKYSLRSAQFRRDRQASAEVDVPSAR